MLPAVGEGLGAVYEFRMGKYRRVFRWSI